MSRVKSFLTAAELAEWLRVSRNTIYTWVSRREVPLVKLPGNTTRFPRAAIERNAVCIFLNATLVKAGYASVMTVPPHVEVSGVICKLREGCARP